MAIDSTWILLYHGAESVRNLNTDYSKALLQSKPVIDSNQRVNVPLDECHLNATSLRYSHEPAFVCDKR